MAALVPALAAGATYEPIEEMRIVGNDLAHSQWVRSGSGSRADPFVISGWERNLTLGANGTELGSTTSYLTMRANHFFGDGAGPHMQCCRAISAFEIRNFTFEGNLLEAVRVGFSLCCGYQDNRVTLEDIQIVRNQFLNSSDAGLRFSNARNFTIAENSFVNTGGPAIAVGTNTAGVRVFHNNFVNSARPPTDDVGADNAWDDGYPSGGNYWSDYTGADQCSGAAQDNCTGNDGIGDTPFVIDADSQDRYPLMAPYEISNRRPVAALSLSPAPADTNMTVTVDASGSSDPDDAPLEFRFDLDGDGTYERDWSSHATQETAFASAGNYTLAAEVRDTHGATTRASAVLTVVEAGSPDSHSPTVVSHAPAAPRAGERVDVHFSVDDPDGVGSVQVWVRVSPVTPFAVQAVENRGGGEYSFTVTPPRESTAVEYYIIVRDQLGHATRNPTSGSNMVALGPPPIHGDPADWPVAFAFLAWPLGVVAATAVVFLVLRGRRLSRGG